MPVRLRGVLAMDVGVVRHLDRHRHEPAMAHAALGDEVPGIMLNIGGFAPQDRHFHAAFVIEMNVQRGLHQVVVLVPGVAEALGKPAHLVVVDIGERRDAFAGAAAVPACSSPARSRSLNTSERAS